MDNLKELFESNSYYEGNGRIVLRDIRPYYSHYDERPIYEFADFVEDAMCKIATPEAKFVLHAVGSICEHVVATEIGVVDDEIMDDVERLAALFGVKFRNVGIGQRVTKLIRKICGITHLEDHGLWNKYFANLCDKVNCLRERKTIVFSINESDIEFANKWYGGWVTNSYYNAAMFMLDSFDGTLELDCVPYAALCLNKEKPGETLHDGFVREMLALAFQQ